MARNRIGLRSRGKHSWVFPCATLWIRSWYCGQLSQLLRHQFVVCSTTLTMQAQRSAAAFEPISPNLDLDYLIDNTPKWKRINRIPIEKVLTRGYDALEELIVSHVIVGGIPLIIEGFDRVLDNSMFTPQWLLAKYGDKCKFSKAS